MPVIKKIKTKQNKTRKNHITCLKKSGGLGGVIFWGQLWIKLVKVGHMYSFPPLNEVLGGNLNARVVKNHHGPP